FLVSPWPGNVRERANVIERAVVLGAGPQITLQNLPPSLVGAPPLLASPAPPPRRIMPPRGPSNPRACARPPPRPILPRAPRPWGCSAPISIAGAPPSASANLTEIHPVSERIQAPWAACRAPHGSRPAPACCACAHSPTPDAPRGPTPGGSRPSPTARRPRL